jgi:plastocyanin
MSTYMIEIEPIPAPTPTQTANFDPPAQGVLAYDTITWHNGDDCPHYPAPVVNGSVVPKGWFDNQIPPGGTSDTLAPGPNTTDPTASYTLNYVCALHKDEKGTITVKPNPTS